MNTIKDKILTFKNRLVKINDEEPLSKLSLVVIIALDIFILFMVFGGLDDHTKQLTSPDEYIPFECQRAFINTTWSEANKMDELQTLVLSDYNNYSVRYDSQFEDAKIKAMHPLCKEFYKKVKAVADNKKLNQLFVDRQEYIKQRDQYTYNFKKSKDVYDTSLLENIADKRDKNDNLSTISSSIKQDSNKIENIAEKVAGIEKQINADPLINELWSMLSPDNEYRKQIIKDYKQFQFWFPLKELLWQLVFMLPIFLIFYAWSSRSVKKNNNIQTLISSHLLVIASIPIILKVMEVVLDLIPKHFFKNLFDLLEKLHIIAIWHYLVILISIGAALLIIYIIQKKIFNKERVYQKRLMKGACYYCGKKLPVNSTNCPFCGTNQFKTCDKCSNETYVGGEYCKNCGEKM